MRNIIWLDFLIVFYVRHHYLYVETIFNTEFIFCLQCFHFYGFLRPRQMTTTLI